MNTAKNLAAAIAAGLLVTGITHAQSADEPRNLQPLFGNFHSAEGYEPDRFDYQCHNDDFVGSVLK